MTVGTNPWGIAVNPLTNKVYVANYAGNVTMIDGVTNSPTTIGVGGSHPLGVAVNPATNKIYVGNFGTNTVSVIDGATNSVTAILTVGVAGSAPISVAVNSVTNKVYVANQSSGTVAVINGADNTVATVAVGSSPAMVAVNPVTNKIYVANQNSNTVTVINGADNSTSTVTTGTNPRVIAVNPVTNKIYVGNQDGTVTAINGADNSTVSITASAYGIAANPVTNKVYAVDGSAGTVTVINGADNSTSTVTAGSSPSFVTVNPVTNTIYVSNVGGNVTVIDGATNATSTVAAGTNPKVITVNPVTNKVYVANYGGRNVTVIDGAQNSTATVAVGADARVVTVNPVTNKAYVINQSSKKVTVIDGATNTTSTVNVGVAPVAMAANPSTNRVYVANYTSATVTVIDGATNTTSTVAAGAGANSIAVNPVTNKIYVANAGSGTVTVIDGATSATSTVSVGNAGEVAVNPVTNKIYVTNHLTNGLTVIDGATNTATTVAGGDGAYSIAINSVTNRIYVADDNTIGAVIVFDGATNAIIATVTVGDHPLGIAVNSVTNKIYVTNQNSNTVSVIDGATNSAVTLSAGTNPNAITVNPVTNKIYVANENSGNVTVIDGATNTTFAVAAGTAPWAIAVNPVTNTVYNVNLTSGNVTVISEQQVQTVPLSASITSLPGNQTASQTPLLTFTAASTFSPSTPPPQNIFFQVDTWQGSWTRATASGGSSCTGTTTTLQPGLHIVYAYADDGQEATSTQAASPLISSIVAYEFLVIPTHFSVSAPASPGYGSAANITVTAQDASNATVTTYSGTVHLTSTDGAVVLPADSTLTSGVGTFSVTFETLGAQTVTATDTVTSSITGSASVTVAKGTPTITWNTPSAISYGTAISATQLNATASVGGALTYSPTSGTILDAGAQTLEARFVPSDLAHYNTATASISLEVAKVPATLALGNLTQTYDGAAKAISVQTTPAGLSVSIIYVGAGGAPVKPGQYTVRVSVLDSDYWGAATATMTINPASQTISFPAVGALVGVPVSLLATASSGLPVSFLLVSGNATLSGGTLTINDTTPVTVQASQAGNGSYQAAASVTQTVSASASKQPQTISFTQPADQQTTSGPVTLVASSSSGLPVAFSLLSGPATLSGNVATLTGAPGTVTVQASQTGNGIYQAAPSLTISFKVVAPGPQTYFGHTGNSSGSSIGTGLHAEASGASGINLAAYVAGDNSSGTLIGYLSAQSQGFSVSFPIDSQGNFTASTTALTGSATAGPTLTFVGRVANAVITGSISELGLPFSATLDPPTGPSSAIAGLYRSSSLASSAGTTYSIVGTQGEVYVLAVTPGLVTGGPGTVASNNVFSVSTAQSVTITGSVDPVSTIVTGSLTLPAGGVVSYSGLPSTTPRTDKLVNLSSRGLVGADPGGLVAGFFIGGQGSKQVLLRAIGPTLASFGISGALTSPVLRLYDSSGALLLTNAVWGGSLGLATTFIQAGAFPLPAGSSDSAAVATLQPGSYTAQATGLSGSTGIALIEIYDISGSSQPWALRVINSSTRGMVAAGSGALVSGFVVSGNSPKKVLVRGIGPTLLASFNLSGTLADPFLQIYDAKGSLVAQNDNWGTPVPVGSSQSAATAAEIAAGATAVGTFPLVTASKDSALITTLAPGAYTAQLSSVGGATGTALIEVYEIP